MQGVTYQVGRIYIAFKRRADTPDTTHSIYEAFDPPGVGASIHRHPGFDETFTILSGTYEFDIAGECSTLDAGDMVVVPRGTPHGFKCTSAEPGRQLIVGTPGGVFEGFIAEISEALAGGGAVDFASVAAKHGIEFLA